MAGCAVQKARKVQQGIIVQLALGCWLGDMAGSALSLVQLSEPHFLPLLGRSRAARWPAVAGMALPWAKGLLENALLGRTGVWAVALVPTFRQHCPDGKWVCDIQLWGNPHSESSSHPCCSVGRVPALSCLPSSDNRVLLRKKCCLLQVALFSPIWSQNLLKCCCGMWLRLKFAGGWILCRASCSQFLEGIGTWCCCFCCYLAWYLHLWPFSLLRPWQSGRFKME